LHSQIDRQQGPVNQQHIQAGCGGFGQCGEPNQMLRLPLPYSDQVTGDEMQNVLQVGRRLNIRVS
jgi:hypothetical protein